MGDDEIEVDEVTTGGRYARVTHVADSPPAVDDVEYDTGNTVLASEAGVTRKLDGDPLRFLDVGELNEGPDEPRAEPDRLRGGP